MRPCRSRASVRRSSEPDVDFYTQTLLELMAAVGGALFLANAWALIRRRGDRTRGAQAAVARSRPGSPVRKQVRSSSGKLDVVPVTRTVTFMLIGFVVAIAALGALLR